MSVNRIKNFVIHQLKHCKTTHVRHLICVSPYDVFLRVLLSFMPPVTKKYQKINVDLVGPSLCIVLLTALVNYGNSFKLFPVVGYPTEAVLLFACFMPILCYILVKLGRSKIRIIEVISLNGYALYGHFFTLLVSFLCFQERSNSFFFFCLIIFTGLSTLRVILIFLGTIKVPIMRLLVCTVIAVVNILYVVFIHFAYMHQTYIHGRRLL